MFSAAGYMLGAAGCMVGGPCDYCVSPSPFGLDFGTLDFGTSDLGLTIKFPTVSGFRRGEFCFGI